MPIIAYQSLNSNSSSEHGIGASNSQYFTRMTHNQLSSNPSAWMLSLPTAPGISPDVPVYGPAHLISSAPTGFMNKGQHDNSSLLNMVEGKARQIYQNMYRAFGGCDLLVYGELDSSHSDWSSMQNNAGALLHTSSPSKACNCFSVHSTNGSDNHILAEGVGWLAVLCYNIVVVFVHVPNAIAKNKGELVKFYQNIGFTLHHGGAASIDVIMGDTNQPSSNFTANAVTAALGVNFADAHPSNTIEPYDSYQRSFGGTNSTATQKYDVAVYNTFSVKKAEVVYLSQTSPTNSNNNIFTAAITDHMGIGLNIEK